MNVRKNWIATIVLLAIFLAVVQVTQVTGKSEPQINFTNEPRDILVGLQGVYAVVENIKPDKEKFDFNRQQFQTDVELRLRQFGVKVLSSKEGLLMAGSPYLYINVTPQISEGIPIAAVGVSVELKENVLLERNPTILTSAATWRTGGVVTVGLDNISQIREVVIEYVDKFINDYLAANPKEQLPPQPKKGKVRQIGIANSQKNQTAYLIPLYTTTKNARKHVSNRRTQVGPSWTVGGGQY